MSDYLILIGEFMEAEFPCLNAQQWMDLVVQGPKEISSEVVEYFTTKFNDDLWRKISNRRFRYGISKHNEEDIK